MSNPERPVTRLDSAFPRSRGVWHRCLDVTTAVGLLCAGIAWGWQGLALAAAMTVLSAAAVLALVWSGYDRPAGDRAARVTVSSCLVLIGAVGLVTVTPGVGMFLVLALAAGSPPVTGRLRRWSDKRDSSAGSASPSEETPTWRRSVAMASVGGLGSSSPADLSALDDAELCLAWRRSYLMLGSAMSPKQTLVVVLQREEYLDELHRRCPMGLSAWFAAGGRASGNPLPYLSDDRSQSDPGTAA